MPDQLGQPNQRIYDWTYSGPLTPEEQRLRDANFSSPGNPHYQDYLYSQSMSQALGQNTIPDYQPLTPQQTQAINDSYSQGMAALDQLYAARRAEEERKQQNLAGFTNAGLAAAGGGFQDSFVLSGAGALNNIRGQAMNAIAGQQAADASNLMQTKTNALNQLQGMVDSRAKAIADAKAQQVQAGIDLFKAKQVAAQAAADNATKLAAAQLQQQGKLDLSVLNNVQKMIATGTLNPDDPMSQTVLNQYAAQTGQAQQGLYASAKSSWDAAQAKLQLTQAQGTSTYAKVGVTNPAAAAPVQKQVQTQIGLDQLKTKAQTAKLQQTKLTGGMSYNKISAANAAKINQNLMSVAGSDKFVSPDDYANAKADWIYFGGTPTDFDTKMRGYRNPKNPNYLVGGNYKSGAAPIFQFQMAPSSSSR